MPAKTEKQRKLMAMALYNPEKVSKNKGILKMSKKALQEFVSTKRKKKSKHKNAIKSLMDERKED